MAYLALSFPSVPDFPDCDLTVRLSASGLPLPPQPWRGCRAWDACPESPLWPGLPVRPGQLPRLAHPNSPGLGPLPRLPGKLDIRAVSSPWSIYLF